MAFPLTYDAARCRENFGVESFMLLCKGAIGWGGTRGSLASFGSLSDSLSVDSAFDCEPPGPGVSGP
eukprot:scaffold649547_cov29-Prasinocladus_malaysianus.AAC.1